MNWAQLESVSYWTLFVGTFLGVAVWESMLPHGPLMISAGRRWTRHGTILFISALLSGLALRVTPVLLAVVAAERGWGLWNAFRLPAWTGIPAAVLVLDFVKYGTHWLFHNVALLWRVHQVHHSDPDFDVSTAGRAHPIEFFLTQGSYLVAVLALGLPPAGVLAAKLLGAFQSFFEHANASVPARIDRWLGILLVTPNMHRTHHSDDERDQQCNLGEVFPWWDRLFGTYIREPRNGKATMKVGLKGRQDSDSLKLRFMLTEPFETTET